MSGHNLAEQSRKLAACQRVMDLIDTYVERPNAGNRLSIREALLELAAHEAEQQAGEAVAWHVVDADGQLMHAAGWKEAAHEHINDALNEYGIAEAAKWRVIPVFTHPQQPLSDEQALANERDRICAAIKAEDDYCVTEGDYMLDSDDCIKIVRGEWVRPDYGITKDTK